MSRALLSSYLFTETIALTLPPQAGYHPESEQRFVEDLASPRQSTLNLYSVRTAL
jgi:hypothetical protein